MSPGSIMFIFSFLPLLRLLCPRWTGREDKTLIIHRPRFLEKFPVRRSRGHIECTGVYNQIAFILFSKQQCIFWETNIVTDANTNIAKGFSGRECCKGISWCEGIRFHKSDSTGDINIEEMHFAMFANEFSRRRYAETSVIYFSIVKFRNRSTDDVHVICSRSIKEEFRRRRFLHDAAFSLRFVLVVNVWKFFCVFGKRSGGIGTVPYFRKDGEGCSFLVSFFKI
mmetsp:Transcript_12028/g.18059  ORF Transcript_12028/g.18059 Transcript_12028/m.18059 type:complete len:225 (-) Transcript_12028:359-1033(-)